MSTSGGTHIAIEQRCGGRAQEACASGYYSSAGATGALRSAGYYAREAVAPPCQHSAAVDQEICTVGTFSAAGATACTTAQKGYYTVDANGAALSSPWQGAVAEAQAGEGYFTVDK